MGSPGSTGISIAGHGVDSMVPVTLSIFVRDWYALRPTRIYNSPASCDSWRMRIVSGKYPCPCCGHLVFRHQPGNHEKCPICLWEDDLAQLRFPRMPGSANAVSLEQAQYNYQDFGSAERRNKDGARAPADEEQREAGWRPLDPGHDNIEEPQRGGDYADSYPLADTTVLYYWRATYWRRLAS